MGFSSKLSQKTRHMMRRYLYFIEGVKKHSVFWYGFSVTQLSCEGPRIVHRIPKGNHTGHSQHTRKVNGTVVLSYAMSSA